MNRNSKASIGDTLMGAAVFSIVGLIFVGLGSAAVLCWVGNLALAQIIALFKPRPNTALGD